MLWMDVWNDHLRQNMFQRPFSFAKNKTISVAQFLLNNNMEQFHLPLSVQGFQEYQNLQELIQHIQISEQDKDSWSYIWGNSDYTTSMFYHLSYKNVQPPPKLSSGSRTHGVQTKSRYSHGYC
jgi:hypothetical protein